jgi:hypothetical protein
MKALKLGRPTPFMKEATKYREFMVVNTQNFLSFFA